MEAPQTQTKPRRRKAAISAMTATLPMDGGGEVPSYVEAPKPRKTRKKKAAKAVAPPPAPECSVSMTLPGVDVRAIALQIATEVAEAPQPEAPEFIPSAPVTASFGGAKVRVVAIGTGRITVEHEEPIIGEGDLVLRVPGLFAELSRIGARVRSTDANRTVLELTRNAVFATFAIDAIKNAPKPRAVEAPPPLPVPQPIADLPRVKTSMAPTRALPATFGDARVALLEVSEKTLRVAHSKPLPLEGDHLFAIKTDVADFSGSFARVLTWERLEDGRDVYVSTIEITGNAVSFTCGIDQLISAGVLQARAQAPVEIDDVIPPPPVEEREVRPLIPIVRMREPRESRLPKRHARPSARAIAAAVIVFVLAVVGYVRRPDDHLRRAQAMIDAYESGLMPAERDYSLPVYANTLAELAKVRSVSVSKDDAERLAERIRREIAQQRARDAVKASMSSR